MRSSGNNRQATRTLRRKRNRRGNGLCSVFQDYHSGLWLFVVGVIAFLIMAMTGLVYEMASSLKDYENNNHHNEDNGNNNQQQEQQQRRTYEEQQQEEYLPAPHLHPIVPVLPPFAPIDNADQLIDDLLNHNKPTMAGVQAYLQDFCHKLHVSNYKMSHNPQRTALGIVQEFYNLAQPHLGRLEKAYLNQPLFPVREDGSIYMSLAAFREHLLADTMEFAFHRAKAPDKLYIGAVVQNCFGHVAADGTIDATGLPCKTGAQVVGKNDKGRDMTKVSDAPPDVNGIAQFCAKPDFQQYCERGQVRVLYVHETESLGPAMARYYASKLWGGEQYFMQSDSHLMFASEWDEKYRQEIRATSNYPKSVLSSYPPGFSNGVSKDHTVRESNGARLCFCETRMEDPNPIVRINTGRSYNGNEPRPTQIPYIAAGFFFARAECLTDWPFDPYMPWLFMGEEIALSMRAWTNGWNIYAPRKNLIAHQYRPGRMGLPKFWGTVNRLFQGRPGNTGLQKPVIKRVKHLAGYPDSSLEKIKEEGLEFVLTDLEHFGLGTVRTWQEYMDFAHMSIDQEKDVIICKHNKWCNAGEKD